MSVNTAIIGIGSNIDAEKNISGMLNILTRELKIISLSSFIKTKPLGIKDQPDFINGAVKIETTLEKDELNHLLKTIESQMGRNRTDFKSGPRTIDLDIIVWNDKIIDKDYYHRNFLRTSVKEITVTL